MSDVEVGPADRQAVADGFQKYERIREQLTAVLSTMAAGERLPSERELAVEFDVSRMTIRQAISGLARSGYVRRVQGAGTYVADPTVSKTAELTSFSEDMRSRGMRPSSVVLAVTQIIAGAELGHRLVISPGEQVFHIERVRLADGQPMCLETVDIPARLVPGLDRSSLDGSLYDILETRHSIKLVEADQTIKPTVLDQRQAELLRSPVLSPALMVRRVGFDRLHVPIEQAVSIYRGDRYDIRFSVRRSVD